jgi:TonB family protein
MRVFVALLLAACAEEEASAPPPSVPIRQPEPPPGECEPIEYTVAGAAHDAHFRVSILPDGAAKSVELIEPGDNLRESAFALDVAREVFHCRRPLSADALRVVESYAVHFRPVEPPRSWKLCGQGVRGPDSVDLRIALDEDGRVVKAWPVSRSDDQELQSQALAGMQRCRFSPARAGGERVRFVFQALYTYRAEDEENRERVYPIQEHRAF